METYSRIPHTAAAEAAAETETETAAAAGIASAVFDINVIQYNN